jgi:acetylornithine deacetylase/succinyl-diaminopimelate desuccinylase-like protein
LTTPSARLLDLACAIQQIPAPTFHEQARAEFVRQQFAALNLQDVEIDRLGNVYARRPGGDAPPLLITAHTDTVFPLDTPLTLTRTPDRISGPGIGDNSLGVAGLIGLLWALDGETLPGDLWLAANVGEEGLGDLRGMRGVMERLGPRMRATIVIEGMSLGHVYHSAIGVRRYRFTARAEGGHSWLHFGRPSAIHALMRLGAQIAEIQVPAAPKTTFNIGTLSGGTSINTIAREASMDVDLRSESPAQLSGLAGQVEALAKKVEAGVTIETAVIGERPAGSIPREHPLAQLARRVLTDEGLASSFETGSTDANIPLSRGWPCVVVGLTRGANAHRPDEYIETAPVEQGLAALAALVRAVWDITPDVGPAAPSVG